MLHRLRQDFAVRKRVILTLLYSSHLVFSGLMFSLIRLKQWSIFPSSFCLTVTFLHFMKMHSYVISTLGFETDPVAAARGFPSKCTLKNFAMFLIVPCLVYEPDYPRNPHPFRKKYFFTKAVNLATTLAAIFMVASSAILPAFQESHKHSVLHTFAR